MKTERLREKLAKLAPIEKRMLVPRDQQVSPTDPDSRSMATSGRGSGVVGYNVQAAVDTEHQLIVTHEVTNSGWDRSRLANVAKEAKAVLQTDKLKAVADRGYFNGEEVLACEEAGILVTLPKPMTSGAKSEGRFGNQDFVYLPTDDVYRCPAGERIKILLHRGGASAKAAAVLDKRVPDLHSQEPLHDRRAAPHHALGASAPLLRPSAGPRGCSELRTLTCSASARSRPVEDPSSALSHD